MKSSYTFLLVCGVAAGVYAQSSPTRLTTATRTFSVRDSIEMRTFSDPFTRTPGATAKEAPDGRGFVVVTTQGNLEANTLESCVWYFPRKALMGYLDRSLRLPPTPMLLFRTVGVPEAQQFNSYGSLITGVQWSSDSRSLTFLVEKAHGPRHLYRYTMGNRDAVDITPDEGGDVFKATSRAGTSAYLVSPPQPHPKSTVNTVSTVLTGQSIFGILFPDQFPDPPGIGSAWKLRVHYNGRTSTFPLEQHRYFPYTALPAVQPSISPNGRFILAAEPVDRVPRSWAAYKSANVTERFVPSNIQSDRSGRNIDWPWQYALIDLVTRTMEPLVDAPTGYLTGWNNPYQAQWSHSGRYAVVTNTYLKLDSTARYTDDSISPCAIAEYDMKLRKATCVAETPTPERGESILSVAYDSSDNIAARWMIRGIQAVRRFDRESQKWYSVTDISERANSLQLYIHQDLDVPPTLWVRRGAQERLLWDPNPRLREFELGKASIYEWTDSSGHVWHGGLVLPPGPKPHNGFPLVIQTHGFYNQHEFLVDGSFTTGFAAQPLACAGIAVLQVEDRPDKHARPAKGEADDEVRGFESALDKLAKDRIIDTSRVGIIGFSRTHWYVEKALEHSPERYKAAILIDGVDMSYFQDVLTVPGYPERRIEPESANGAVPYGPGLHEWLQNAVGFNLDKVKAPVLLEAIDTFSVLGEWETFSMLLQQGKPVDFIELPHGQHILQKPRERYVSQQGTVDWFRFWLQGYERPNPEDPKQYERWGHLKAVQKTTDTITKSLLANSVKH